MEKDYINEEIDPRVYQLATGTKLYSVSGGKRVYPRVDHVHKLV